jgi:trans-aconitate 2-methyltransferase
VPPRWDAALYAVHSAHHRRHDADFLGGLRLPAGARVLDVGCGVGELTAALAGLGDGVTVLGVDADPGMVAAATRRHGGDRVAFAVARAQELDRVVPAGSVDAVFSTAALHWVPAADHPGMLAQVRRVLRPGGLFRAEFGGHGQIAPVRAVLDAEAVRLGGRPAPWFFPTPQEYGALLAAAGFTAERVELRHQRRPFPTAEDLLGLLRSQLYPAYEPALPAGAAPAFRAAAQRRAVAELRRPDGTFDLDFVRLDLLAHSGKASG